MFNVRRSDQPAFFRDAVRDLERAAKLGVKGVKVWKDLGMYARDDKGKLIKADDLRLDPFWARCGELGLPVLMHTADEKEYWQALTYNSIHYGLRADEDQHYHNPEMPAWDELIRQRNWLWVDPLDAEAVRRWQERAAFDYAQYLQYFETDRHDLLDPNRSGGAWFRMPGVKLPKDVLEKIYHANAEKLIPGLERK